MTRSGEWGGPPWPSMNRAIFFCALFRDRGLTFHSHPPLRANCKARIIAGTYLTKKTHRHMNFQSECLTLRISASNQEVARRAQKFCALKHLRNLTVIRPVTHPLLPVNIFVLNWARSGRKLVSNHASSTACLAILHPKKVDECWPVGRLARAGEK